jgi:hypothetical protein
VRLRVLLGTLFALLGVSIAASLGFGPATASAIYNYDAPAIARVCAHEMGRVEASQFQLSVVRDMSAPPSGEVRGASTTSTRSFIATNTADDLAIAESHLGSLPDGMTPPNRMMLDRIAAAQESGRALTVGEQNFLVHETTEAGLVSQGLSQDAAHAAALETHPLFMNYDPEVIKAYPEYFNSNWRKAWDLP